MNNRPECPECGREMGLVTWTGPEPPRCASCNGATVTNIDLKPPRIDLDTDYDERITELIERDRDILDALHD